MPLLKFFEIFPAGCFALFRIVVSSITASSRNIAPINCRNVFQLTGCRYKLLMRFFALGCFIIIIQKANAQTTDTNSVDTASMRNIDSLKHSNDNNESSGYDDEDDGYVDTTVKHIYDTSQYFFNWKKNTDDTYTKEKITQRHLIDEDVKELKSKDDFWYVSAIEKLEVRMRNDPKFRDSLLYAKNHELTDENKDGLLKQPWFNTLLWIIIIVIFSGAVIYFLLQNKINLFSEESVGREDETSNEEDENIFHLSYTKLIQNAEKQNNYRVAVRLMFLQALKLLSETNNIQYQPDYTNLHYLQQLHLSKLYNEFFKVMRSYEYIWYGKFNISPERYTSIKKDFLALQNRIT